MAVNINIPSQVTQDITEGVTSTAPSEDAVFNALALKANSADLALVATSGDYNDLDNLPSIPSAQVNSDWNATSGVAEILNKPTITSGTVTSVDLTMPTAFSVSGNPITSSGTLAVAAAGLSSQYIRGDGQLANFPTSSGGGSSVNFYLNGSVAQGTLGGVAFKQMSSTPVIGTGTDFTINADGYIQSFITDASVPNQLSIPGGNWNFEMYFSASSNGGTPRFYLELYKLSGGTLTLLASSSATPEFITNGIAIDLYTTALAVPSTVLLAADRLAVRVYVIHSSKTITLHTENSHLCQVITTFSTGLTALNGLTSQVQNLAVGTSGTDFAISSATNTHTFNLPTASASNRGALSTSDWTAFNGKQAALVSGTNIKTINGTTLLGSGDITVGGGITVGTTAVTSGTIGRVFFQGTGNVVQQDAGFIFDSTAKTLTNYGKGALSSNTSFGALALSGNTTGTNNTALGNGALQFAGSGANNTALGFYALNNAAQGTFTGAANIGIGYYAGAYIISGQNNIAIGYAAGGTLTTGSRNTMIGGGGLASNSTNNNVIISDGASNNALWKDANNFVGIGHNPTSGTLGAKLDVKAQGALSTDIAFRVRNSADNLDIVRANGAGDVFVGLGAGRVNTGTNNSFVGQNAGYNNTTGSKNTANGVNSLYTNTTGVDNTAIGYNALQNNTTAGGNTAIGSYALLSNTGGTGNTAIGSVALYSNTSGFANTANGFYALFANTTGGKNTAIGHNSLYSNTTGNDGIAHGYNALQNNTTGNSNTATGSYSLLSNTTGNSNTAIGSIALYSNTTGSNNTAQGLNSGRYIADGTTANSITNNSLYIGSETKALANNQTNQIVIGHNAIGAGSNTATLGNTSIVKTILRGTLNAANLPTSPTGLVTGDIWNNLGILTIV
jgi:hypothetical protein